MEDKEKLKLQRKIYYQNNKEKWEKQKNSLERAEYMKNYSEKHKNKKKEYDKKYKEKNKQKDKIKKQNYYKENKETILKNVKRNYKETKKNNPEILRNIHLKRKYGITVEDYNKILQEQKECCMGCRKHQSEFIKVLCVDHCHTTGQIRGLLCNNCNRSLGLLGDNISTIENLLNYLKKFSHN